MTEEIKQGMTRREVLKKGAIVGGTLVWAVPVVQAVGMSPAMAKAPSEGTCCLRVFLSAEKAGTDSVDIHWKVKNCGPSSDTNIRTWVEQSADAGASWQPVDSTNIGALASGAENSQDLTRGVPSGSYSYRIYALYDCGGSTDLRHNVPGDTYLTVGPIVI